MDSIDIGHVPPPNPENFWRLNAGQERTISGDGRTKLALLESEPASGRAKIRFFHSPPGVNIATATVVDDWLNLHKPCVVLRTEAGEPALTLTLRVVQRASVALQGTYNPKLFSEQARGSAQ